MFFQYNQLMFFVTFVTEFAFHRENFKLDKTTTDDEIEKFILNLDHFITVTYNNDKVIVQLM